MKATIDRIEGDQAVVLLRSDESIRFILPLTILPKIVEGDIIDINIVRDEKNTKEARERVTSLIEKLKNKKY